MKILPKLAFPTEFADAEDSHMTTIVFNAKCFSFIKENLYKSYLIPSNFNWHAFSFKNGYTEY